MWGLAEDGAPIALIPRSGHRAICAAPRARHQPLEPQGCSPGACRPRTGRSICATGSARISILVAAYAAGHAFDFIRWRGKVRLRAGSFGRRGPHRSRAAEVVARALPAPSSRMLRQWRGGVTGCSIFRGIWSGAGWRAGPQQRPAFRACRKRREAARHLLTIRRPSPAAPPRWPWPRRAGWPRRACR